VGGAAVRVVVADDAVLFREGVANLLRESGFEVVGQAGDAVELLALVRDRHPDVVILDIRMPPTHRLEGLEAAREIRTEHPDIGVLVLSQYVEAHYALRLLEDAAQGAGYLLKDRVGNVAELTDAVRQVGAGRLVIDPTVVTQLLARSRRRDPLEVLTHRERQVLSLMAEGRSNHAIARTLFVSDKTVEAHVRGIFTKLDLPPEADDHRRVLAVVTYLSRDHEQ
jgi:DNA-binding NarL/FixJ family response regulator